MSGGGVGIDLGPRSSTGWRWALDPRDPERLEMRAHAPAGCLVVSLAATCGLLYAFLLDARSPWLLALAFLPASLLLVRVHMAFDRRRGVLERGFVAMDIPFLVRRSPLAEARRILLRRDDVSVKRKDSVATHTFYRVELAGAEKAPILASAGTWEPAREFAELCARFLSLPLDDKHSGIAREPTELDEPVERPVGPHPPAAQASPRAIQFDSSSADDGTLVLVVPRPRMHLHLFIAGLVLVFWTLPVSIFGSVWFGLLPLAVLVPGWLKTAYGYSSRIEVRPGSIRIRARGLVFGRTLELGRDDLEELIVQSPDQGGPREMIAQVFDGFLVARTDRRSIRFGHGLATADLRRLRHVILDRLCDGAPPAETAAREHALRAWPRRLEPVLGLAAGAGLAHAIGGPLAHCASVPFLEHVANAGGIGGAAVGLLASTWRVRDGHRRREALWGAAILAAIAVFVALAPGVPGLDTGPWFDDPYRVARVGLPMALVGLVPTVLLGTAVAWALVATLLGGGAQAIGRGALRVARAAWRFRLAIGGVIVLAAALAAWNGRAELLRFSVRANVSPVARALVVLDPDVVNARDDWSRTAIHFAASNGREALMRMLLERGADPNARDWRGRTPMHHCLRDRTLPTVALLLQHGADPNAAAQDGETPLMIAAGSGSIETAKFLLARGARVNAVGPEGYTALHRASITSEGDPAGTIRVLAEAGIDPSIRDLRGRTARDLAKVGGFTDRLRDLLVFEGSTPLGEEP